MVGSPKPLVTPPSSTLFNPENDPVHRYALVSTCNVDERFVRVPNLDCPFATHRSAVDYRYPQAAKEVGLRLVHDRPECICPPDDRPGGGDKVILSNGRVIKVYDAFNYAIILNRTSTPHALSCWTCLHDDLTCTLSTWYRGSSGSGDSPRLVDDQGREMAIAGKCVGCVQTGEECHLEGIDLLAMDKIVVPESVPIRCSRDGFGWRVSRWERSLDLNFVCSDFLQVSKPSLSDANKQVIAELRDEAGRLKRDVLALRSEHTRGEGTVEGRKRRNVFDLGAPREEYKRRKIQKPLDPIEKEEEEEEDDTASNRGDLEPPKLPDTVELIPNRYWLQACLGPLSEVRNTPLRTGGTARPAGCSDTRPETFESSHEPQEVPGGETKPNAPPLPSPVSPASAELTSSQPAPSTSHSGGTSDTGHRPIEQPLSDAQSALHRVAQVYLRQDRELTELRAKLKHTQDLLANSVAESKRGSDDLENAKAALSEKQVECSRLIEERDAFQARAEGLEVDSEKLGDEVMRLTEELGRADETIEVYKSEIEEVNRRRIAELDRRRTVETQRR